MKYENIDDQSKDAKQALTFFPQSMIEAASKSYDPLLGKLKNGTARLKEKSRSDTNILPSDLTFGQAKLEVNDTLSREEEAKKNEALALGIGSLSIILLVYFLFIR